MENSKEQENKFSEPFRTKTMPIDLKPCPFCGGKVESDTRTPEYRFTIRCDGCQAKFWLSAEEWNRRATEEAEDNPRNLPCPTCKEPNRLTPLDRARGYQCDSCANAAEFGGEF